MKNITLLEVHINGFKSFKRSTDIIFPTKPGFWFLGGRNEVDSALGANGAGKSSLWDAIFWCLYGVSVKGAKASDLVSWGSKRPVVTVRLLINENVFEIAREGSPEKLWLSDEKKGQEVVAQNAIDRLLGLSKERFKQSVLFGQGARLFFDMAVPERGILLDEILDLSLWQRLAERADKQAKEQDRIRADAMRDITFVSGQLEGLTDAKALRAQESGWREQREASLFEAITQVEGADAEVTKLETEFAEATNAAMAPLLQSQKQAMQAEMDAIYEACKLEREKLWAAQASGKDANELLNFYEEHSDCPTCKQKLDKTFIKTECARLEERFQQAAANEEALNESIEKLTKTWQDLNEIKKKEELDYAAICARRDGLKPQIRLRKEALQRSMTLMDNLSAELDNSPYAAQIAAIDEKREQLDTELAGHDTRHQASEAAFRHADYWKAGFKKVRLYLIKQALAMLEIETRAAASSLGLIDWTIKYVTEVETKSGSMRAGVQILVSSPSSQAAFALQSGGEEQRVKLAISLGLSKMISRMGGVEFNFEVWDEPTNWLSPEGIAGLMESLKYRAEQERKTLWCIDHRIYDATTFDGVWIMRKTLNGTELERR